MAFLEGILAAAGGGGGGAVIAEDDFTVTEYSQTIVGNVTNVPVSLNDYDIILSYYKGSSVDAAGYGLVIAHIDFKLPYTNGAKNIGCDVKGNSSGMITEVTMNDVGKVGTTSKRPRVGTWHYEAVKF